jgi:hypothetical protein
MACSPDAQHLLQLFYSGSVSNAGQYRNAAFDRVFRSLCRETGGEARISLARLGERCLIDDSAAIFLVHQGASHFVSPRILNYQPYCTNPFHERFYERIKVTSTKR